MVMNIDDDIIEGTAITRQTGNTLTQPYGNQEKHLFP